MHNSNRIRNIELPENLFSNLGEIKKNKKPEFQNKKIEEDNSVKLTNYSRHKEYRDRINNMYDNIENLTPVDSEIDNILYFNNYIEKGIVVKPKVSSIKQFWTEYRLITNEKKSPQYRFITDEVKEIRKNIKESKEEFEKDNNHKEEKTKTEKQHNEKLNNFDKLFDALSKRVNEINNYIDELKEMRLSIDESSAKLEADKDRLKEEKKDFTDYKKREEEKIQKEKDNLRINYDRLQTIINDLDKKLNEIEK
ncbi:MAG: hypothetical protein VZS44_05790 [Bacilli bacterium]|nr:hypothetical protein [Bacilli bacterium]